MPEPFEGGPEAVSLSKCHERGGQWAKDQAESQNRDAKANEAVEDELAIAFAVQGRGCEIAGQAHEFGIAGAEERIARPAKPGDVSTDSLGAALFHVQHFSDGGRGSAGTQNRRAQIIGQRLQLVGRLLAVRGRHPAHPGV